MAMIDKEARAERRRRQEEGARRLRESGVLDDLFAKIDAGEVPLGCREDAGGVFGCYNWAEIDAGLEDGHYVQ